MNRNPIVMTKWQTEPVPGGGRLMTAESGINAGGTMRSSEILFSNSLHVKGQLHEYFWDSFYILSPLCSRVMKHYITIFFSSSLQDCIEPH